MIFKGASKFMLIGSVVGLLASTVSTDASANYTQRSERFESTFKIVYDQDYSITADNGNKADFNSDWGWGFTLGYNLNEHILINYDFSASTPRYHFTGTTDKGKEINISRIAEKYDSQFNVIYNLLTSSFTPYVQAGAGWTYMDSNVADGPPIIGCIPTWWGPYCEGYQSTFDSTDFSYNVAVGVRYELRNHLFFRASYRQSWIDISRSENASFGAYQVEIGSIF